MNFIDISSYQAGIDLEKVFANNPLHGVVVKSTEGMNYVNPYCDRWVQWLIANNKPWGFYHFLNGKDPTAEAERFVRDTENYWGHGVPVADYEGNIVREFGTYYLRRFLEVCYAGTGIKPLVYCNLSTIQSDVNGFRQIAKEGYQLWLAQYANTENQVGFRENPWQQGSYKPFDRITMHQYSDHGLLVGYGITKTETNYDTGQMYTYSTNYLDLDIFYGDRADWDALARETHETPPVEQDWKSEAKKYLLDIKAFVEQKIKEIDNL